MKFATFSHIPWPEGTDQSQVLLEATQQIQRAEALGFEAAWIAEHHFSRYGLGAASLLLAAHFAAKTSTIRIGIGIVIAPLRHPIQIAEEIATLDVLSNGRLDFGFGVGGKSELMGFNVDSDESRERFQEIVQVVIGLLTNDVHSHAGRFYRLNAITLVPRPVQQPYPPLYAAVRSAGSVDFAARSGLNFMVGVGPDHQEALEQQRQFVQQAATYGRVVPADAVPFFRYVYVAETDEQARREAAPHLTWVWEMMEMKRYQGASSDVHVSYESWLATRQTPARTVAAIIEHTALIGSPETCVATLRRLQDAGVGYFGGNFGFGGLPHQQVLRSLELFATRVMPELQSAGSRPVRRTQQERAALRHEERP